MYLQRVEKGKIRGQCNKQHRNTTVQKKNKHRKISGCNTENYTTFYNKNIKKRNTLKFSLNKNSARFYSMRERRRYRRKCRSRRDAPIAASSWWWSDQFSLPSIVSVSSSYQQQLQAASRAPTLIVLVCRPVLIDLIVREILFCLPLSWLDDGNDMISACLMLMIIQADSRDQPG